MPQKHDINRTSGCGVREDRLTGKWLLHMSACDYVCITVKQGRKQQRCLQRPEVMDSHCSQSCQFLIGLVYQSLVTPCKQHLHWTTLEHHSSGDQSTGTTAIHNTDLSPNGFRQELRTFYFRWAYLYDQAHSWRSTTIRMHRHQISKLKWTDPHKIQPYRWAHLNDPVNDHASEVTTIYTIQICLFLLLFMSKRHS